MARTLSEKLGRVWYLNRLGVRAPSITVLEVFMSYNSWKFLLLVPALALSIVEASRLKAQVKPFKIQGGGTADYIPTLLTQKPSHVSTGQATELGNHTGKGSLKLTGGT